MTVQFYTILNITQKSTDFTNDEDDINSGSDCRFCPAFAFSFEILERYAGYHHSPQQSFKPY